MKRDMDLVRKILLEMESCEESAPQIFQVEGYSDEQVGYHVHIMAEAGLLKAIDITHLGSNIDQSAPLRLTWDGHEFLDVARQPTLWEKAKQRIASASGAVTIDILVRLLKQLASEQLGL